MRHIFIFLFFATLSQRGGAGQCTGQLHSGQLLGELYQYGDRGGACASTAICVCGPLSVAPMEELERVLEALVPVALH